MRGPPGIAVISGHAGDDDMKNEENPEEELLNADAPSHLGVRNPYALANGILLKRKVVTCPIDWTQLEPQTAQSLLEDAFGMPYRYLFDPNADYKLRSPLYTGMSGHGEEARSLNRKDLSLSRKIISTGSKTRLMVRTELPPSKEKDSDPSSEDVKVGSGASWCTTGVSDWIARGAANNWVYDKPAATIDALSIKQGCTPDCYFVAALIAYTWTSLASLGGAVDPDPAKPGCRVYNFRNKPINDNNSTRDTKSTQELLAVDTTRNLVFARPANNFSVWPSLYEKAYALFRLRPGDDRPAIGDLSFYNPVEALWEVVGSTVYSRDVVFFRTSTSPVTFDTARLMTDIRAKGGNIPATAAGGRTTKAMVAWTYVSSTETPFGDSYTDDLIVANHAYTVLGALKLNNVDCVVLRNPYGFSSGTTKAGVSDCTPTGGTWTNYVPPGGFKISDGNFAMTADAFTRFFKGYASKV
jgi:hypothetical protein